MTSEPWTRAEQINYATFGTKEAPKEWNDAWVAVRDLAKATNCPLGTSIFTHFNNLITAYHHASMSVD